MIAGGKTVTLDNAPTYDVCDAIGEEGRGTVAQYSTKHLVPASYDADGDGKPEWVAMLIPSQTYCNGKSESPVVSLPRQGATPAPDVCGFVEPTEIKKEEMRPTVRKIDVTGDGLDDYVLVPNVTYYKCDGTTQSKMGTPLLIRIERKPNELPSAINMKKEKLMVGNIVSYKDKEYMLVAIPNGDVPAPFDGNVLNRDKIIVVLVSTDTLKKLGEAKDLSDMDLLKEVAGSTTGARLGDLKFEDDIAELPEDQGKILNRGLHVFGADGTVRIELFKLAVARLMQSERPKDEGKK